MKIYAITATDERMTWSADIAMASASCNGATATKIHEIDNPERTRGAGYWRWMPIIVHDAIIDAMHADYDFVVYMDAGVKAIRSLSLIAGRMRPDDHVWVFGNEHNHVEWCKADCLHEMGWKGKDTDKQVQASVHIWRATPEALRIANEWRLWCEDHHMIDDSPSELPNMPRFKEHRHPQAVLTNIVYKHGLRLHWWPVQYGHFIKHMYPIDNYPQIFEHHRLRNPGTNEAQQPEWTPEQYKAEMEAHRC